MKKTILFTLLAFALFTSLGTTAYAGFNCPIDDPIVDPDLLDRPRISSNVTSNGSANAAIATTQQQHDQTTLVFKQVAGVEVVIVQTPAGKIIYTGTVNPNTASALSALNREEDTNKPEVHNK
jgi:hypothetical protein